MAVRGMSKSALPSRHSSLHSGSERSRQIQELAVLSCSGSLNSAAPGMAAAQHRPQVTDRYPGIPLGRVQAEVSEQLLHGAHWRPGLKQVGCVELL